VTPAAAIVGKAGAAMTNAYEFEDI